MGPDQIHHYHCVQHGRGVGWGMPPSGGKPSASLSNSSIRRRSRRQASLSPTGSQGTGAAREIITIVFIITLEHLLFVPMISTSARVVEGFAAGGLSCVCVGVWKMSVTFHSVFRTSSANARTLGSSSVSSAAKLLEMLRIVSALSSRA